MLEATTPNAAAAQQSAGSGAAQPADDPGPSGQPGRLLIYSAITGHTPMRDKANDPANRYRTPAEREAARARSIEAEIAEELAKQERLSAPETATVTSPPAPVAGPTQDPGANPLSANPAPELRDLPGSLFETEDVVVPPGQWQNQRELHVQRQSLDVDHDGEPEEIRYTDKRSGQLVRVEQDLDFDGRIDTHISYDAGAPSVRVLDTNGDGRSDTWERYTDGRVDRRHLDQDADGVQDTFYEYDETELVRKTRDADNNGQIDRVEAYRERRRVSSEEDRSRNGVMDTWTTYGVVDGQEVVAKIDRDSRDSGKPDVFETYHTINGETRLVRREEDVNGDGKIDVVSIFEDGKLVQRAISDEALSPL